jgi:hypothetical protein
MAAKEHVQGAPMAIPLHCLKKQVLKEVITIQEDIVPHDYVNKAPAQNLLGRECSRKVRTMQFESPTDCSNAMVIVNLGVHQDGICGIADSIRQKWW